MTAWQTLPLSEVVEDARPGFACGEDISDGVFQFRMNNVTADGQLDLSKKRRIPRDTRNLEAFRLEPGDVLFNATNSPELVGKSAFFPGHEEPAVFSNHFFRLRPDVKKLDGRFLARWLTMQFQRRLFQGMCRQWVNQATVGRESLLALRIPIPPLREQRRIADILDRADALRSKRHTVIARLDTLTQSIFLDLFGDPATNPKDWPRMPLGELAERMSDGPFGSNLKSSHYTDMGVRVIRLQNIGVGEFLDDDKAYISHRHFAELGKHECRPGDVLIGTLGDPNVRACIQPEWLQIALNKADCVQFRPNQSLATAQFICSLLNQPSIERMAQDLIVGQTRLRISMGRLRSLHVPVPPITLQREYAERVIVIDRLKSTHKASVSELGSFFLSLQQLAFSEGL